MKKMGVFLSSLLRPQL